MSTISMNTIYSNEIRKNFKRLYDSNDDNISLNDIKRKENLDAIYNIITAIIGPFQTVTQVNLYTLDGLTVGSGFYSYDNSISLYEKSWYDETLANNGYKYISKPEDLNDVAQIQPHLKNHKFISLCRLFFNEYEPDGIVEVIQDCDIIFSFVNEIMNKNDNLEIYILNQENDCIYPYNKDLPTDIFYYNQLIKDMEFKKLQIYDIYNMNKSEQNILTYTTLDSINWRIMCIQSKDQVYAPLTKYLMTYLIFAVIVLLVTLLICFIIARKVMDPLNKFKTTIKSINDLMSPESSIPISPKSELTEIQSLFETFNSMYNKLCISSKELITVREEELRAKIIATQSLINPHFIYNNLTNISIMADNNMNSNIISLCSNLCDFLRYISTNSTTRVSIKRELSYVEKYLSSMKIRYGKNINYLIDISPAVEKIEVPKLIIQPIVENTIRHAFHCAPPWDISIKAFLSNDKWLVEIKDNGIGFSNDVIEKLKRRMQELKRTKDISSFKIGGMGLLNVYLRLVLEYEDDAVLDIRNPEDSGSCITIGGKVVNKKLLLEEASGKNTA